MHDSVTLANWIATLQAPSLSELDTAFKEYRDERFPIIQDEFVKSQGFVDIWAKVITDKGQKKSYHLLKAQYLFSVADNFPMRSICLFCFKKNV